MAAGQGSFLVQQQGAVRRHVPVAELLGRVGPLRRVLALADRRDAISPRPRNSIFSDMRS